MLFLFFPILSSVGAVTLDGSAEYAIPGSDYNLTCTVPDEATAVRFYRRPLMTQTPQDMQVTGNQCYILVSGSPVLCTPDVCSCQPSTLHYAIVFRLVLQPILGDHNSLWFCRRQNSNLTNEYENSPDYTLQVLEEVTSITLQNPPPTLEEHQAILLVCVTSPCRPAATVQWSVGGADFTSSSTSNVQSTSVAFVTISRLTLTINRSMRGHTVICSAKNTDNVVTSTIQPTLDVQYGPDTTISLLPPTTTYTRTEGDTLLTIACSADCIPGCSFVWTKPDNTNFTVSAALSLGQLDRSEHGTYKCTAGNVVGASTTTVNVIVWYPPSAPIVIELSSSLLPGIGVNMELSCDYLEGFPSPADVEWFRNGISIGLNGTAIVVGPLLPADNGNGYACRVRNAFTDSLMMNLTSPEYFPVVSRE